VEVQALVLERALHHLRTYTKGLGQLIEGAPQ
jgi:hypothetical protein